MTPRVASSFTFAFLFVAFGTAASQSAQTPVSQPESPNIAGVWVLNPALTQRPAEIGFSRDWARAGGPGGEGTPRSGGGRGRRGGGSGGAMGVPQISRESADDSTRVQQLTEEARTPPAHLTIVQKATSVSIADDQGHSRTFHPDGHLEELTIGTVALPTTAHWDAGKLVVVYDVESGRQLRYTYTPSANPPRLLVDIRFIEPGREGDEVQLTYEAPEEHDRAVLSGQPTLPVPTETAAAATPAAPETLPGTAPGAGRPTLLPPGSELRGISTITTVVEDLSAQAAACGLDQTKIQTSIAKILADAGFKTQTYGREDADVLVSVVTSKLPDGACVSRYDASVVSHADATFPYLKGTVAAVEVLLLHDGGMVGGSPTAHASAVIDALAKSVNRFVTQIRVAGK
ncbi:MAG TPA: hypothetical protein VFZ98_06960 [Vicinamibacterales bacterium]